MDAAAQAPPHLQGFTSAIVTTLDRQREVELQSFDTLSSKRRADGFLVPSRQEIWTLYGGLSFLGFQNKLEPDGDGAHFKLGRSGPGLNGKLYIGIHRRY